MKLLDGTLPEADGEYELEFLLRPGGLAERAVLGHWHHYKGRYLGSIEDLFQEAKLLILQFVREKELPTDAVPYGAKLKAYIQRGLKLAVKRGQRESGGILKADEDGRERQLVDLLMDRHPESSAERAAVEKLDEAARLLKQRKKGNCAEFSGQPALVLDELLKGRTVAQIGHKMDWPPWRAEEEVAKVKERMKRAFHPHGDELVDYFTKRD